MRGRVVPAAIIAAAWLLVGCASAAHAAGPGRPPTCPLVSPGGPSRLVAGPPPADVLARLEVLRRPATAADRAFGLREVGAATIKRDFVRLLGSGPHGERYFLVPATLRPLRFSLRCKRRLPAARRRAHERVERAERRAAQIPVLLLHEVGREGGSTSSTTIADILENDVGSGCIGRQCQRPPRATVHAPVPDGVEAVRLRFRGGLERTVTVQSNFWVTEVPLDFDRADPISTTWLGSEGQTIREFADAGV